MQKKIESSTIQLQEVRLHVRMAGPNDGPLVILLHGFPEFWYGWRNQIEPLAAAGFRVLAPDQRGYNLSDKPRGVHSYQIHRLVGDVIGLLDALERQQAFLVGHDWGGAVAWQVARVYPARVHKLAVINIPHPAVMQRTLRQSWRQRRKSWYMLFFQIPWLPEFMARRANWRLLTQSMRRTSRRNTFTDEDFEHYQRAWAQPGAITAMIHWYRGLRLPTGLRRAGLQISVPTLLIWGVQDRFLGQEMAEPSIEFCDSGRLELIEAASHWVQHEEAPRVNRLLLDFFDEDK